MSLFFWKNEKRARGRESGLATWNFFGSNRKVKPASSYQAETIPVVVGLFNAISDNIAQSEPSVFRRVKGVDVAAQNPKWLDKPNGLQTPFDFWEQVVQSMLYHGNAYIYKLKNAKGVVVELHVIHPEDVEVRQEKRFGPVTFTVAGIAEVLTAEDILHIKAYPSPEGLYGQSPIQSAKMFVDAAYSAQKYSADLYEDNLNLAGVIETPKVQSKDEAIAISQGFAATHRSGAEGGSPIGVLGGGASFKPINLTPEQAQFIESERWNAQKFATLLNVPLFMVDGSAGSWAGTGLQVMNTAYKQRTLQPWVKRIEDAFTTFLLGTGLSLKFNLSVVLRSSELEQAEIFAKNVGVPIQTVNEARAIMNWAPVEGGDKLASQNWFAAKELLDKQALLNIQKIEQEINLGASPPGGV